MSGEGGDMGGGGGDTGGGGKGGGGGGKGGGDSNNSAPISYGGYSDPSASSAPASSGGYTPSVSSFAAPSSGSSSDPFSSSGSGSSGLPSLITGGSSGGVTGVSAIDDFFSGGPNGLNLAGSGPVGGSSPAISGGMFSSGPSDDVSAFGPSSGADPGLTSAASGGGTSASAFAAPEGVSGTPQLADLVKQPDGTDAGAGGIGSDIAASGPGQGVSDMLSGLNAAEKDVTDQWAANNASSVPAIGSDAAATTSPLSTGGATSSGGSGGGSGGSGLSLGSNPMGTLAAGAGLINNLTTGNKSPAYSPQLNATAGTAAATGAQQTAAGTALQQYVATGTLPAGYEAQVQQQAQAAKATIIANYANRGLPTDPTKNSMLAQELAQVDAKIPAMREQIAATLAQTGSGMIQNGLQATGIQSGVYQSLANLQDKQNQQRAQAIANFAASLNGGVKSKAA